MLCKYYQSDAHIAMHYLLQEDLEPEACEKLTLHECYINLTLIKRSEQRQHEEQFTEQSKRKEADYNILYVQEYPILLNDIWQVTAYEEDQKKIKDRDNYKEVASLPKQLKPPHRLVIRGAAGVGKTTTLKHISAKWHMVKEQVQNTAEISLSAVMPADEINLSDWQTRFEVVLYLPLNKLLNYSYQSGQTMNAAVAEWLERLYPELALEQSQALAQVLCSPTDVNLTSKPPLLLLDGFDEISFLYDDFLPKVQESKKQSAKRQQLHGQQQQLFKKILAAPYWIITTRPHLAAHQALKSASHHLALTGLSLSNIVEYVQRFCKAFNKSDYIEPILQWLKQGSLNDLARIPLQLELLCSVALEQPNPQKLHEEISLTGLYSRTLLLLIKRFLQKNHKYLKIGEIAKKLEPHEQLARCEEPLTWLSKLALESMLQQQTQFRINDLAGSTIANTIFSFDSTTREDKLTAILKDFGLVTPLGAAKEKLVDQQHYFQHFTYQEFLAAYVLTKQLLELEKAKAFSWTSWLTELLYRNNQRLIEQKLQTVQGPYYYRMQVFMAGFLGYDKDTDIFFTDYARELKESVLEMLLRNYWVSLGPLNTNDLLSQESELEFKHFGFKQALQLLEAVSLQEKNFRETGHDILSLLRNVLEQAINNGKHDQVQLYLFSKRLLKEPIINMLWQEKLEIAQTSEALKLIKYTSCPLPLYLKKALLTAAVDDNTERQVIAADVIGEVLRFRSYSDLQYALLGLAQNSKPAVRERVAEAIGRFGKQINLDLQNTLIILSQDIEIAVRQKSAEAILQLSLQTSSTLTLELKQALTALLHDEAYRVRASIAKLIIMWKAYDDSEFKQMLMVLLGDRALSVRESIAEAITWLALCMDTNAKLLNILTILSKDTAATVRQTVIRAIQRFFQVELTQQLSRQKLTTDLQKKIVKYSRYNQNQSFLFENYAGNLIGEAYKKLLREVTKTAAREVPITSFKQSILDNLQLILIDLLSDKHESVRIAAINVIISFFSGENFSFIPKAQTKLYQLIQNIGFPPGQYAAAQVIHNTKASLIEELNKAAALFIQAKKRYYTLYKEAENAYKANQLDNAIELYHQALAIISDTISPRDSANIYHDLACIYDRDNSFDLAEVYFEKSLALYETAAVHCDYGLFFLSQKKVENARIQFEAANECFVSNRLKYRLIKSTLLDKYLQEFISKTPIDTCKINPRLMSHYQLVYCAYLLNDDVHLKEAIENLATYIKKSAFFIDNSLATRLLCYAKQYRTDYYTSLFIQNPDSTCATVETEKLQKGINLNNKKHENQETAPFKKAFISCKDQLFNVKSKSNFNRSKNLMQTAEELSFLRYEVPGGGDCGYTAFGITRKQAYNLLKKSISKVEFLFWPVLREVLPTEEFYQYLIKEKAIQIYITHEYIIENLEVFARNLNAMKAYIDYDIRDKKIDAGYVHPCILQALACIQNIELHLWVNEEQKLVPHPYFSSFTPDRVTQETSRLDILLTSSNYFELLDKFILYAADNPNRPGVDVEAIKRVKDNEESDESDARGAEKLGCLVVESFVETASLDATGAVCLRPSTVGGHTSAEIEGEKGTGTSRSTSREPVLNHLFNDNKVPLFFTTASSTTQEKDTHWYSTYEMNQLTQLVAQEHNNVDTITPLLGTNHLDINELADTLKQWQDERHVQLTLNLKASKILVPLNIYENHWVLLYFILPSDSAVLKRVYYFDPLGGQVPNQVASAVATITDVNIINLQTRLQDDGHNCGPWVIAAAASLITNDILPNLDFDIEKARSEQQQALTESQLHPVPARRQGRTKSELTSPR